MTQRIIPRRIILVLESILGGKLSGNDVRTILSTDFYFRSRILGQCVGVKHNEDWRRLRSHIDVHFSTSIALEILPSMISDVSDWLTEFPALSEVQALSKDRKRLQVQAHELVASRLLLTMVARILFGELVDNEVGSPLNPLFGIELMRIMYSLSMNSVNSILLMSDLWLVHSLERLNNGRLQGTCLLKPIARRMSSCRVGLLLCIARHKKPRW